MKSEIYKRNLDTPDELLTRIFDAGFRIRKRENQLRRTTPDLHTRFAKCIEVDGRIFRTAIVNGAVGNLSGVKPNEMVVQCSWVKCSEV
jgi:hypothetical protein